MSKRQAAVLNILSAIVFAAAMIAGPRLFNWESNSVQVGLLIAVWFIPFSILSSWTGPGSFSREIRCLSAKFSRREE